MKANSQALTLVEVVVVIVVGIILFLSLFGDLICNAPREPGRKARCKANLVEIGKAMALYREGNGGYFPFSWQRAGEAEPADAGAANSAMPATSLGNLYPRYVQNAKLFKCPSTEDVPSLVLNLPLEYHQTGLPIQGSGRLPAGSNWSLTSAYPPSSYGYDPRVSPRAVANHALMADMDGSWQSNHDTATQNHYEGQNVLYVDGHVAWQPTNFCSTDPHDNIFAEDAWDADTDTYLLSKDAGLGISFDGYKHLQYPTR